MRGPFLLPTRIGPHRCERFWERIAVDVSGCKLCGNVHVCHLAHVRVTAARPRTAASIDPAPCSLQHEQDGAVCTVTGLYMQNIHFNTSDDPCAAECTAPPAAPARAPSGSAPHPRTKINNFKNGNKSFKRRNMSRRRQMSAGAAAASTADDYPETLPVAQRKPGDKTVEGVFSVTLQAVREVCRSMLCSQACIQCLQKERQKLHARVRWSIMQNIRKIKRQMPHRRRPVQVLGIISAVAEDLQNYRMLPVDVPDLRQPLSETCAALAEQCAQVITSFLNKAHAVVPNFMYNVPLHVFIVGVLYLLRVGLIAQHIVLLPQMHILTHLIPCENLLEQFFQVKCKNITEVENIIKLHTRMLSRSKLLRMQCETACASLA